MHNSLGRLPKLDEGRSVEVPDYPLKGIPALAGVQARHDADEGIIPDDEGCRALWDRYDMLDNIRAHSLLVANVATRLAEKAVSRGFSVNVRAVRASALLHDIAKTWCLRHGGSHAELGASWVLQETGNRIIAKGVFHHVYWPWELPVDDGGQMCSVPFFVLYADKRARHDAFVSLEIRYEDLLDRYGRSERHRESICASYLQIKAVESALSQHLGMGLEHTMPVSEHS